MYIRRAIKNDVDEIRELFYNTIHHVNNKDYSPAQLEAWSGGSTNVDSWTQKVTSQYFVVAIDEDKIAGFGSITTDGYVDFIFVHKDYQGKGMAKSILSTLEQKAQDLGLPEIWADVSITARPFFNKQGFTVANIHTKVIRGISFENAIMKKGLQV